MAYTYRDAIRTAYKYLNIEESKVTEIEGTNGRGIIYTFNGEKTIIFIYPISCKQNNKQNFFDTRDSGVKERVIAWNYAKEHNLKYFCLGFNEEQDRYKDYVLSLESDERSISSISFRTSESSQSTGTQVNIPNDFIPTENFQRIRTPKGFYIAAIHVRLIHDYINMFDNRPYMQVQNKYEVDETVEDIVSAENGANILFYGVPGAGKSHEIDRIIDQERTRRVVFHPDYTYSDFVGQILPRIKDENLKYVFVPGPFTQIMKQAYRDEEHHMYYLVIEEINRGNAPAIFGDIFQLLDRNDDGSGKYSITNYDMGLEIFGDAEHKIRIPSNLTILATMNTSDQNVFTLDTAFQRRWEMHLIKNDVKGARHANKKIEGSQVSWGTFAEVTNEEIEHLGEEIGNAEDKRLGAYFASEEELKKDKFPEKVLKYLWDDAFKMDRYTFFSEDISSIDNVIEIFQRDPSDTDVLQKILKGNVYDEMMQQSPVVVDLNSGEDDIDDK